MDQKKKLEENVKGFGALLGMFLGVIILIWYYAKKFLPENTDSMAAIILAQKCREWIDFANALFGIWVLLMVIYVIALVNVGKKLKN